jgi:type IV secretory pathway VirB4 component
MATKNNASQKFVPIQDVKDNVVVMKDGRLCMILLASSINFALKSLDEQKAILMQFQNFLNTLDFSIQFYIQSRRLNIDPYLEQLRNREDEQYNDLMRIQLREYIDFIQAFTNEVDVMSKNFFIVIPYTSVPINVGANISSIFGNKQPANTKELAFEERRLQLEQRASLVEQGLARIGVRTAALENEALVELYYHIFNPSESKRTAPHYQ